jgi:hypothetical protein
MRLHLRKQAEMQVRLSQDKVGDFPMPEWYETELVDAAAEDDATIGLGRMTVVASDLLEQVRRADPAYELTRGLR